ncbi:type I restriction-modification system subunit M N-terminal domain-containing protein [Micromonospora sp. NPDC005163]
MAPLVTGRRVQGCGAVPGREVPAGGESADVADVADQAGGAGGADAVEVLQAAAGGLDELGQFLVRGLDLLVDLDQFGDQLGREPAAGAPDQTTRPDRVEQGPGLILRRLDCILEPDREAVRALAAKYANPNRLKIEVKKATGRPFYNTSNYSFANLLADADGLADNLADYIDRFSPDVDVFQYFDFKKEILALDKAGSCARSSRPSRPSEVPRVLRTGTPK